MWGKDTGEGLLGHTFGGAALAQPSEWWVQLHYGPPGPSGAENAWSLAGRKTVQILVLGLGRATNEEDVEWAWLPGTAGNNELQFCTIWDAETSGTCLQVLEMKRGNGQYAQVRAGQGLRIPAGQLDIDWKGEEEAVSSSSLSGESSSQSASSLSSSSHSSSSQSSSSHSSSTTSQSSSSSSLSVSDLI